MSLYFYHKKNGNFDPYYNYFFIEDSLFNNMDFTTRDYEIILPEYGTATIISVKDSNEMGIYVNLLEFDNIEGLLLFSEVSRRRVRSMVKLIKIGKKEIVSILRVDKDKNYIDVSKRQITETEVGHMKKKRSYSKLVNLVSNNFARYLCLNFEENRLRWIWQLGRKFFHVIRAFKLFSKFNTFPVTSVDLKPKELEIFLEFLKRKIRSNQTKIEIEFEMIVFSSNGVQILKNSIRNIIKKKTLYKIHCKTLISPRYLLSISGQSKKKMLKLIIIFLKELSKKILSVKGFFQLLKLNFT